MGKPQRRLGKEFEAEAVRLVETSGRTQREIAEDLGIGLSTLRRWHQRFAQQRAAVQAQGFDPAFQRTWEFYLAYCEASFDTANIDVVQYTLVKD